MRLTDRRYWEGLHSGAPAASAGEPVTRGRRFKDRLKRLAGSRLWSWTLPYDDHLLWHVVLPRYLSGMRGRPAVEIGSAPGRFMVRLADTFGVVPFGVEYTATGATANRAAFAASGYDPAGVIEADVFSPEFQAGCRERFDVVISRGFIEHFTDPADAVAAHRLLLRPGGVLVVQIPNLRGIYYPWTWLFNREQLPLHNLSIMRLAAFQALFDGPDLTMLQCGYHGTFSFWLFTARPSARVMRHVVRLLLVAQRGLDVLLRLLFGRRGAESAWLSPSLLYVGRKERA